MSEYDSYLVGYQRASVTTEVISATLNAGQAVILAGGLTAVLAAAAMSGSVAMTAGDLVRPICSSSLLLIRELCRALCEGGEAGGEVEGSVARLRMGKGCMCSVEPEMHGWCRCWCKACCCSCGVPSNSWVGSTGSCAHRWWTWMPSSRCDSRPMHAQQTEPCAPYLAA